MTACERALRVREDTISRCEQLARRRARDEYTKQRDRDKEILPIDPPMGQNVHPYAHEHESFYDDVEDAFDRMDTNRDNLLSRDEFRRGIQPHGSIDLKLLQTPQSQSLASGRSSEVSERRYSPAGMAQSGDEDDRAPVAWFVKMASDRGSK